MSSAGRRCDALRAFVLWLPSLLLIIGHLRFASQSSSEEATGFIQYDQAYYMANARQYLDGESEGLCYGSPFSAEEHPAPIYFQPQIALLAALWGITGWDPGIVFNIFGCVSGLLFVWLSLCLLRTVLGGTSVLWIQVLFIWGGGLLFGAGLLFGLLHGDAVGAAWDAAFRFDPANGYWFLNWGRNLVYPLEAYYHALFVGMVLLALRGRWSWAVLMAALLALSHPFTGAGALLMLLAWVLIERFIVRSWFVPGWVVPASAVLLVAHVLHHAVALPGNAEHAQLIEQWSLPWTLPNESWLAGYTVAVVLVAVRFRSPERMRSAWSDPTTRLLISWVVVWSVLEHHEIFTRPIQPLHFTRGYVWAGLFLLGAPALAELASSRRRLARPLIVTLVVVMLSDNVAWLGHESAANAEGRGEALLINKRDREVLADLDEHMEPNALLVCKDPYLAYLALVYTSHRAYCSHHSNTPFAKQRFASCAAYFEGRITDPMLNESLIAIASSTDAFPLAERGARRYESGGRSVYRMPAQR